MYVKYDKGQLKLLELRMSRSIHGVQAPFGDSSVPGVAEHRVGFPLLVAAANVAVNAVLWRSACAPASWRQWRAGLLRLRTAGRRQARKGAALSMAPGAMPAEEAQLSYPVHTGQMSGLAPLPSPAHRARAEKHP